jgi:PPM family protein phosphatase
LSENKHYNASFVDCSKAERKMPVQPSYTFAANTNVGLTRITNEDFYGDYSIPEGHVFILCDGVGGERAGEIASRLAVEKIGEYLQSKPIHHPYDSLLDSITSANKAVFELSLTKPDELFGMGTTCVVLLLHQSVLYYAHAGDSRLYRFHGNKLFQLTKDHSYVQDLLDRNIITKEEALFHHRRHEISSYIGAPHNLKIDISEQPIIPETNDIFLLCSDGLTDSLADIKIEKLLTVKCELQQKADLLVGQALKADESDNITVQLLTFN